MRGNGMEVFLLLTLIICTFPEGISSKKVRNTNSEARKPTERSRVENEKGVVRKEDSLELDPMKCFPKALCGVSSEVAQISNRRKNGLITDYLLLMRAIARNPEVVHQVLSAKEKGVALPLTDDLQEDTSPASPEDEASDTSASEEDDDQSDEEEDDQEEENQVIKSSKKREQNIPKNDEEFNKYHLMAQMDKLLKDTLHKESESENWWNLGDSPLATSQSKPSWWRSPPAPVFGQQSPGNQRDPYFRSERFPKSQRLHFTGQNEEPSSFEGGDYEPLAFRRPVPTLGLTKSKWSAGPSRSENFALPGPSQSYYENGPSSSEVVQDSGPYYNPYYESEYPGFAGPPRAPTQPSDGNFDKGTDNVNNEGGSGISSFVSKLFSFGSGGGMFGNDPFFDGMGRDLSSSDASATKGITETKEILETAMAIGKEFDKPSKCNEIFNACQFEYTELLYMIDDLRYSLRRKFQADKDKARTDGQKSSRVKSSPKSKRSKKRKGETRLSSKKSKAVKSRGKGLKKVAKSHKSNVASSNSDESSEERYVIPLNDPPPIPILSFSNLFSWFGG